MIKTSFKLHPIAILYMLRSYWYLLTAPFVRIVIQNLFFDEAARLFLSEKAILSLTSVYVILKWLKTNIIAKNNKIIIDGGVLAKKQQTIERSQILSITTERNILDILMGCATCYINTESDRWCNTKTRFKISVCNAEALCSSLYGKTIKRPVEIKRKKRRYLTIPSLIVVATMVFMVVIGVFYKNLKYNIIFTAVLLTIELYYALFCYIDFKQSRIMVGDVICAQGTRAFKLYGMYCNKNKIEAIKISQTPIDKYRNTCKIHLLIYINVRKRLKIKNVDFKSAKKYFNGIN